MVYMDWCQKIYGVPGAAACAGKLLQQLLADEFEARRFEKRGNINY
jgi:hypothetical protein